MVIFCYRKAEKELPCLQNGRGKGTLVKIFTRVCIFRDFRYFSWMLIWTDYRNVDICDKTRSVSYQRFSTIFATLRRLKNKFGTFSQKIILEWWFLTDTRRAKKHKKILMTWNAIPWGDTLRTHSYCWLWCELVCLVIVNIIIHLSLR